MKLVKCCPRATDVFRLISILVIYYQYIPNIGTRRLPTTAKVFHKEKRSKKEKGRTCPQSPQAAQCGQVLPPAQARGDAVAASPAGGGSPTASITKNTKQPGYQYQGAGRPLAGVLSDMAHFPVPESHVLTVLSVTFRGRCRKRKKSYAKNLTVPDCRRESSLQRNLIGSNGVMIIWLIMTPFERIKLEAKCTD